MQKADFLITRLKAILYLLSFVSLAHFRHEFFFGNLVVTTTVNSLKHSLKLKENRQETFNGLLSVATKALLTQTLQPLGERFATLKSLTGCKGRIKVFLKSAIGRRPVAEYLPTRISRESVSFEQAQKMGGDWFWSRRGFRCRRLVGN